MTPFRVNAWPTEARAHVFDDFVTVGTGDLNLHFPSAADAIAWLEECRQLLDVARIEAAQIAAPAPSTVTRTSPAGDITTPFTGEGPVQHHSTTKGDQ